MAASEEPTCATCIHWKEQPRVDKKPAERGHCRRYPPQGVGHMIPQQPLTAAGQTCGEHPDMKALAEA